MRSLMDDVLEDIELPAPYQVQLQVDRVRIYALLPDTFTGVPAWQWGPWHGIYGMSRSQVIRAVFGAYMAFIEHEAREGFKYRGVRVFGPHIDVDALAEIAGRTA